MVPAPILHCAASWGRVQLVHKIMSNTYLDVSKLDYFGETVLHAVITAPLKRSRKLAVLDALFADKYHKHYEMCQVLRTGNPAGVTPFQLATEQWRNVNFYDEQIDLNIRRYYTYCHRLMVRAPRSLSTPLQQTVYWGPIVGDADTISVTSDDTRSVISPRLSEIPSSPNSTQAQSQTPVV